jgi:PadR family transcriptional regulator PadR
VWSSRRRQVAIAYYVSPSIPSTEDNRGADMKIEKELMRGAGPAAVLMLLEGGEKYGYELIRLLDRHSRGVLAMGQSTLYPLLYNLEAKNLVASRTLQSESGRPRKYYHLTRKGKQQLAHHRKQWEALTGAINNLSAIASQG